MNPAISANQLRRRLVRPARGVTLVELVVSLAVVSVLLTGMTSAIVLATQALPTTGNAAGATVETSRALHQLRGELHAATVLLQRTATSVVLHLPDRDGDGRPQVIRYTWSGTPGDPLTRSANSGPAINVIDTVQDFTLGYTTSGLAEAFPGPVTQSAEVLLSSYDTTEVNDGRNENLESDKLVAAQLTPGLPSAATQYRVTRALVYAQAGGTASGQYAVQIRPMNGSEPSDTVTDSVNMQESDLTNSLEWSETVFADAGPFGRDQDFALVLEQQSGGNAGRFRYDNTATANLIRSNNGGSDWNYSNNDQLVHFAYGTYDVPGDDWTYTHSRIEVVDVQLVHADAPTITHRVAVPLPNAPKAADAIWEADFNADPTTLDYAADGTNDWQDDGSFDATRLSNGRWEATDTLASWPENQPLDQPFTLDAWIEDTVANSDGGGVRLRFDRSGSLQAFVTAEVDLDASNQNVLVFTKDASGANREWVNQTRPSGSPVHISLAVDPANDTVAVCIDNQVVGSFTYERLTNPSNQDNVKPFVDGTSSGVFIDHVRLSTGGSAAITPGAYSN